MMDCAEYVDQFLRDSRMRPGRSAGTRRGDHREVTRTALDDAWSLRVTGKGRRAPTVWMPRRLIDAQRVQLRSRAVAHARDRAGRRVLRDAGVARVRPLAPVRAGRPVARKPAVRDAPAACGVRAAGHKVRYLASNPWAAVTAPKPVKRARKLQIERALPFDLWARTRASRAALAGSPRVDEGRGPAHCQGDRGRAGRARAASGRRRDPGDLGAARDRQGQQGTLRADRRRVRRHAARALARSRAGVRRGAAAHGPLIAPLVVPPTPRAREKFGEPAGDPIEVGRLRAPRVVAKFGAATEPRSGAACARLTGGRGGMVSKGQRCARHTPSA